MHDRSLKTLLLLAVLLLIGSFESKALAARFFVSNQLGNDLRSPVQARLPGTPWKSIQRAIDFADAGDTVVVLPGTYNEHVQFRKSGTQERPIKLLGRQFGRTRILGSVSGIGVANIVVSGLDVSNSVLDPAHPPTSFDPKGIYFYYAHHIEISTNIVRDCRGGGIGLVNTDEVLVCDNIVSNNAAGFDGSHSGISIYQPLNYTGEHGDEPGITVCRNLCFNNRNSQFLDGEGNPKEITDGHGIIVDDTMATQRGNFESDLEYFWSVAPHAPSMPIDWQSPYSRRILIESNVCHSNGGSGVSLFICENVIVSNNSCLLNQRNLFDIAEINLGGASDVLVHNNLMISPLRVTKNSATKVNPAKAAVLTTDLRQAAKLSDNYRVNDAATIFWVSNALYDSTTLVAGLSKLHDWKSIALKAPTVLAVNPITGAINLNLNFQVRDKGTANSFATRGDFCLAPRVQGTGIDIGAVEATAPPRTFATPAERIAFQLQLAEEAIRTPQLPRFTFR